MSTRKSRIAAKHVNVMDRVTEERRTFVPQSMTVVRVDTQESAQMGTARPGAYWDEWNDLTLGDLVRSGLLGE